MLNRYLDTFRVVVVSGARQVGKTTLLRSHPLLSEGTFLSFDRPELVARATESAIDLLGPLPRPIVIDEYQRAGNDLLLGAKYLIDRDQSRGQLVLAGSTNFLTNRLLSETLAGRIGILDLLPLSRGELLGHRETFIDEIFESGADAIEGRTCEPLDRTRLAEIIAIGGYPEAVQLNHQARRDFFESYLTTIVGRESLADVGAAQTRADLARFVRLAAGRTSQVYQSTNIARDGAVTRQTAANYIEVLGTLGLLTMLPAWSTSLTTRTKKAPKLVMNDTALVASLLGHSPDALRRPDIMELGPLAETYVVNELLKASTWSEARVNLYHHRWGRDREVDVIVERADGQILAIEVKTSSAVRPNAFRHLRELRDKLGHRFTAGFVLYGGNETWRLEDRLWAAPLSTLWAKSQSA